MSLLITYIKPYWKKATLAALSVVTMALASLLQPQFLSKIMEAIIKDDSDVVLSNGIFLLGLALLGMVAGISGTYFSSRVSQAVAADIRAAEYEKIQAFSLEQVQSYTSANLVVRLTNDVNQVQQLVMQVLQMVLRVPILLIGAIVLSIWTIPSLWWVVLLMIVLIIASSGRIFSIMGKSFQKIQSLIDQNNTLAQENLAGVRVVKSFNQEAAEEKGFSDNTQELTDVNQKIGYLFNLMFPIFMLISYAAIMLALLMISGTVVKNPDQLAKITPFITYLNQILFGLMMMGMISTITSRGFVSLKRIGAVLAEKTEEDAPVQSDQAAASEAVHQGTNADVSKDVASGDFLAQGLSVSGLDFAYADADENTLTDISFDLAAGQTLGVVGSTGSGKSTLALVLARLYQATRGQVSVDGQDINNLGKDDWRQHVSIVMQKPVLFSGTIRKNIQMGKADASDAEIMDAVTAAQAADFVSQYDDGLDHEISERSANLSGGQKQRLSLARALVKKPRLLILDDSTSALDARSEKRVQDILEADYGQTTKVIIAEKIASIIHADQILVLDEGRVVGQGTHQELLTNSALYQEIFESQKGKEAKHD
ncbi:ABC transporter ATP-binding protein/permease [Fructobacillus sp. W13]|uniref:ABC transporter ATP-binding protein/permease n=1 Tax=Fructobacillus apis TaxID=2935017 RepID=A0ABT0ZPF2_9LACO|nr:ABC transporter ATP-binding protein [Fructobacillus apis]MCO0831833.1 ABC transporter ATP-binding protein/permease [Fructobacillus apis]